MFNKMLKTKFGIIVMSAFVVLIASGALALADVIIQGGNNVVYDEPNQDEQVTAQPAVAYFGGEEVFGGNLTATGGICDGSEAVATMCNVDINYLDVSTDFAVDGATTLTGAITMDGSITLTDGSNSTGYFYEVIDFTTATYTQAVFNPDSLGYNDFYLIDAWLENTEKATSSVRLAVTTSTATVIASDDSATLTEDDGSATLMKTFGNVFGADGATFDGTSATGSMFSLRQYPGTDSYLQAGTNAFPFLINSTTNMLVYATTSSDGPVYFSGKLHIVGKESDR